MRKEERENILFWKIPCNKIKMFMHQGIFILLLSSFLFPLSSFAYNYSSGRNDYRLTATGAAGGFQDGGNFGDFLIRAQISRMLAPKITIGVVYAYDELAMRAKQFARDAFIYQEMPFGRYEIGWTESIASKLALVLPDVGGTRLNNAPFFLERGDFAGISNPAVYGNQYAVRANIATTPAKKWQFGIGQAAYGEHFQTSTDAGLRYRNTGGRYKTQLSFGASWLKSPDGVQGDIYTPPVYADNRYQGTFGFNLQRGSLLWGLTLKGIYDENSRGAASDGIQAGTGLSYQFLRWAASANYIFSDVGVWRDDSHYEHTGILSLRYKATKYLNVWSSAGVVWSPDENNRMNQFLVAGMGVSF